MADSELEVLIKARDEMSRVIDALDRKLNQFQQSLAGFDAAPMEHLGDAAVAADDAIEDLEESLEDVQDQVDDLDGGGAEDLADDLEDAEENALNLSKALNKVEAAGRKLATVGGLIVGVFASAAKGSADFEKGIAEVATLTDEGSAAIGRLSDTVLNLSDTYGIAKEQVTGGLYQAISKGAKDGAEAVEFMEVALENSIGGVTDVETSVNGLINVINAWKLEISDAEKVSDVLFTTVKRGGTNMEELSSSMFQVAPLAASLGVEFEEIAAAIATMTKSGTETSVAFTQIRGLMQALIRPSDELNKIFTDATGKTGEWVVENQGLAAAIKIVTDATEGSKGALTKLLGSIEAVNGALSLSGKNTQVYTEDLEAMEGAAGAASKAFETLQQTDARQYETALVQLGNTWTRLGGIVLPIVSEWLNSVSLLISQISGWVKDNEELAGAIATVVGAIGLTSAAIGTLLLVLAPLVRVLRLAHKAWTLFKTATVAATAASTASAAASAAAAGSLTALTAALGRARLAVSAFIVAWGPLGIALTAAGSAFYYFLDEAQDAEERANTLNESLDKNVTALREFNKYAKSDIKLITDEEINEFKEKANTVVATYRELQDTARKLGREDLVKQYAEDMEVYKNKVKELNAEQVRRKKLTEEVADEEKKVQDLLSETSESANKASDALLAMNELDFDSAIAQLKALSKEARIAATASADPRELQKIEEDYTLAVLGLTEQRTNQQIVIEERRAVELKRILDASTKTEQEKADETLTIVRNLSAARISALEEYRAVVVTELGKATTAHEQYATKVISLEQKIKLEKERQATTLNDILAEGLTAYEQYSAKKQEFDKLNSDFLRASLAGDYEEAERIARRQEQLAIDLNKAVTDEDGEEVLSVEEARVDTAERLKKVYENINSAQAGQKTQIEQSAAAEQQKIQTLQEQITETAALLDELTKTQLDLEVNIDQQQVEAVLDDTLARLQNEGNVLQLGVEVAGLEQVADDIEQAAQDQTVEFGADDTEIVDLFTRIERYTAKTYPIKLAYQVVNDAPAGSGQGFARGGPVWGAGSSISDSIMAWLSNGEFVVKAAAVRHYGMDFFRMLNAMALPKTRAPGFANGGPVMVHRDAQFASVGSGSRDQVDVRLMFDNQSYELTGDREEVRKLNKALKSMGRGTR